jgi:hypothetical protein
MSAKLRAANISVSPSGIVIRVDLCPLYSIEAQFGQNSQVALRGQAEHRRFGIEI